MDPILYFVQALSFVAFIGGLGVLGWSLWLTWRSGQRRWPAKAWSIVLLLAAFVVMWIGWSFHLLGLGANY